MRCAAQALTLHRKLRCWNREPNRGTEAISDDESTFSLARIVSALRLFKEVVASVERR